MADRILFVGWNRVVAGREKQAMKLWLKSIEFYGSLQSNGRIDSFEPVILSSHGGDLNGYMMLRGDADKLAEVQEDETFIDLIVEADYCLNGFGVVPGYIGDSIMDRLSRWSKLFAE